MISRYMEHRIATRVVHMALRVLDERIRVDRSVLLITLIRFYKLVGLAILAPLPIVDYRNADNIVFR